VLAYHGPGQLATRAGGEAEHVWIQFVAARSSGADSFNSRPWRFSRRLPGSYLATRWERQPL